MTGFIKNHLFVAVLATLCLAAPAAFADLRSDLDAGLIGAGAGNMAPSYTPSTPSAGGGYDPGAVRPLQLPPGYDQRGARPAVRTFNTYGGSTNDLRMELDRQQRTQPVQQQPAPQMMQQTPQQPSGYAPAMPAPVMNNSGMPPVQPDYTMPLGQ